MYKYLRSTTPTSGAPEVFYLMREEGYIGNTEGTIYITHTDVDVITCTHTNKSTSIHYYLCDNIEPTQSMIPVYHITSDMIFEETLEDTSSLILGARHALEISPAGEGYRTSYPDPGGPVLVLAIIDEHKAIVKFI